jgi:hypothetical protein
MPIEVLNTIHSTPSLSALLAEAYNNELLLEVYTEAIFNIHKTIPGFYCSFNEFKSLL